MSRKFRPNRTLAEALLRDAQLTGLSEATRIAAAFEAGSCFLQHAMPATDRLQISRPLDPAALSKRLEGLQCSPSDRDLGVQLAEWYERRYELPPAPCSADVAVSWALRMRKL